MVGCATDTESTSTGNSIDYCDEIVPLLEEFDVIAIDGYFNDDSDSLRKFILNAEKISSVVRKAENNGVDLTSPDAEWFRNLQVSAQAFITLAEAEVGTFTDDELAAYLERIVGWYDYAGEECRVVVA